MATAEKPAAIPKENLDALQAAIEHVIKGIRDPKTAHKACQEMDQAREEMRRRLR